MINILYVCKDYDYAMAFSRYASVEYPELYFKIIRLKDGNEENMRGSINADLNDIDIILCENKEYTALFKDSAIKVLEISNYLGKSASQITELILELYYSDKKEVYLKKHKNKCRLIYVCSCKGGTGKTCVSLGICQELARYHGKKTLYLNYEDFNSSKEYLEINDDKQICNYLYSIEVTKILTEILGKEKNGEINLKNFVMSGEGGFDYFSPENSLNTLKKLDADSIISFINKMAALGMYKYIIVDGNHCVDICDTRIMRNAWKNIRVESKYDNSDEFSSFIEREIGKNSREKFIFVENQNHERKIIQEKNDYNQDIIGVEYDKNLDYNKISLETDFGTGIKEIVEKLIL